MPRSRLIKPTLVTLGTVAWLAVAAPPARAQYHVIDTTNLMRNIEQVRQLAEQLQAMERQYRQLQQSYQAIAHAPAGELEALARRLDTDRLRNALPGAPVLGAVMEGLSPGEGALEAAAGGYRERNRVHAPAGADFQAQELRRNAASVAGAQAMADTLYRSASERVEVLRGIEAQLSQAGDVKAVADLAARIDAEQAYIQAQQVQAQSLALWQQAQLRNRDQRAQEERRRSIDALIEQARARGG